MKTALDGSALAITTGGLRRYTEELARALRECGESVQILRPHGPFWWSLRLPLRLGGFDLFHGTNFEVPYMPVCASVMTVHDVSPWLELAWHSNAARVRTRAPALMKMGLATMMIVPTNAIRGQLLSMFSVHPDRVAAVYEGARMQRADASPVRPYFLFVGTIEPRKNIPALIEAWRPLRERADLTIAGRRRADAPAIGAEPGLTIAGEVPEAQLAELYSGAVAMVYPSLYEGFGLPVVEAMQCGTPVVLSRDPALMEVAGGAAIHVDSHELTAAMRALLDNVQLRAHYSGAALRRGSEFTWTRTARLTLEVYGEAIARSRTIA